MHYAHFDLCEAGGRPVGEVIFHVSKYDGVVEIELGPEPVPKEQFDAIIGWFGLDRILERAGIDPSDEYYTQQIISEASLRRALLAERAG